MIRDPLAAKAWILDVDGCLVRTAMPGGQGGVAMPGAGAFIDELRQRGCDVVICTNASERPPEHYAAHLRSLGIPVTDDEFVTAGSAAADFIAANHEGKAVLVVGEDGLSVPLARLGMRLVDPLDATLADVVVCGAGETFTRAVLNAACLAVDAGAPLYATHDSPWFHGGRGKSVAVTAAIAAAIAWTTGAKWRVLGKPSPALAETLVARLGGEGAAVTVVGDASAEIGLARHMGAASVTVLSGALSREEIGALKQAPDAVFEDVSALLAALVEDRNTTMGGRP